MSGPRRGHTFAFGRGATDLSLRMTGSSFHAVYAVTALVGAAAVILWYGLLNDQFQISYVWNSSERSLPTFYKFAAIWGGQAGSLLFWNAPAWPFQHGDSPDLPTQASAR